MSTAGGIRQDMPPKGGYSSIQWERIPLKKPWSGFKMFVGYAAITIGSYYFYAKNIQYKRRIRRENEDVTVAIEPLLMAERDRIYLNQLRKNREEEAELMKDVPGWKVGTYFGDPIYRTTGDFLLDPSSREYYAHCHPDREEQMFRYEMWF